MKKLFWVLGLLVAAIFAQEVKQTGQKVTQISPVTWTTGANTGKTRIMLLGNSVYLDTSSTGQTGSWKRIDNTTDSCSNSFLLAADTNGVTRSAGDYGLWGLVRSVDADSSTHLYRMQFRERVYNGTLKTQTFTPWTRVGANSIFNGTSSPDTVAFANAGTTSKISQFALFSAPLGTLARFCPDDVEGTAGQATDSVFVDSLRVFAFAIPVDVKSVTSSGSSGTGGGAEGTVDLTGINGFTPSTSNGTAGTGTLRVAIASNNTAFSVNASATGPAAHDAAASGNPVIAGGVASAAAPTSVSADGDAVQAWHLRNGAQATVITAAGALVGGDATNGLDVDVTRLPALVAGTANIGDVDVLTVPTDPFGANADAASATGSISAKLRFIAATGIPITSITAGNNNIGDVDVASSALPSGAATSANQSTEITHLATVAGAVKAEDAAHTSTDPGIMPLAVRRDANTTLADATGDYAPLQVDASGSLKVAITAGAGSGGTSIADDAAFTPASTSITPVGGTYRSTLDAVDDGDAGAAAITANRAIHVNLRDASGNEVSVGGGTQYDDDAVYAGDGAKVTMAGVVRRDANTTLAASDGDVAPLQVNAAGQLKTEVIASALPSGAATAAKQPALGTAGTASTDVITVQGIASGTPIPVSDNSSSLTVDYATTGSGTATGALRVELPTNGTGVIATVSAVTAITNALPTGSNTIGALTANQSVNVSQINGVTPLMGAGATGTGSHRVTIATDGQGQVVDNAGFTDGTTRTDMAGFIFDEVAGTSLTENDAAAARVDAKRALVFALEDATTRGQRQAVSSGGAAEIHGDVAHDAPIGGNPVRIGLRAATADYTAVATGDQADVLGTIDGKIVTKPHAIRASTWTYAAASGGITNTTAATIKTAAAAGVRNCLTSIQVINGHATVSTEVLVRDGAAGTVLHRGWAQAAGGGFAANFDVPVCGTAATLMEVVPVTTGSAIYVNAQGYISQE